MCFRPHGSPAASNALRGKCFGRALFTPGLLLGGWCAAVAAARRVVTLCQKNCMKKVVKFVKPFSPCPTLFLFATAQTNRLC